MTEEVKMDCCFSYCYIYTKVSIYKNNPQSTSSQGHLIPFQKRQQLDFSMVEKDCSTSSLLNNIDLRIQTRRHAVACFCFSRLILTSPTWEDLPRLDSIIPAVHKLLVFHIQNPKICFAPQEY